MILIPPLERLRIQMSEQAKERERQREMEGWGVEMHACAHTRKKHQTGQNALF